MAARRSPFLLAAVFVTGVLLTGVGVGAGLPHLTKNGPGAVAVLGLAALIGGALALLVGGMGLARVWSIWRRLLVVASLLVLAVIGVYVLAIPVAAVLPAPAKAPAAAPDGVGAEDIVFETADGERLAGWYVPSQNGAAVVLVPGSGSSRVSLVRHVQALAEGGYGVLAIDPRGHGESTGRAMDWGWFGDSDMAGALDFLEQRDDVDRRRVGAVGLSMGGEVVIGAAAADPRIQAVVAEGVTGRSVADLHWLSEVYGWRGSVTEGVHHLQTGLADLLTPASPPQTLRAAATQAAPRPVLLVVAGQRPDEQHAADDIRTAAPGNVEVWAVPGAGHTAGLRTDPEGWRARVLGFLDEALD